uniref:Uncharacterized protein n=1 Tax=Oryza meridionalis TaxID=40149 RepID=A0A0E0DTY8_9ORYZ
MLRPAQGVLSHVAARRRLQRGRSGWQPRPGLRAGAARAAANGVAIDTASRAGAIWTFQNKFSPLSVRK